MQPSRLIPMLPVQNLPASAAFYEKLGFQIEQSWDVGGWAMPRCDEGRLMLDQSINLHPTAPRRHRTASVVNLRGKMPGKPPRPTPLNPRQPDVQRNPITMNPARNPVGWFEIYVQDKARAKAFYKATFERKLDELPSPGLKMVFP